MLIAAITIQISVTSTPWPGVMVPAGLSPGWSTTVVPPMASAIGPRARNRGATPTGQRPPWPALKGQPDQVAIGHE